MANTTPSLITVTPSDDGLVRLQAAEHQSASIMRRLFNNSMCDVTLYGKPPPGVDAARLPPINAHRIILAVVSPVLNERFNSTDANANISAYKLDHIDHASLQNITAFVYTNQLQFPQAEAARNVRSILIGAKHLAMDDLASSCEAYLASTDYHLSAQTCISTWLFAVLYECNALLNTCLQMFALNVSIIRTFNDFLHLSGDNVVLLIKSMLIEPFRTVANADDLSQAAVAWLEYDRVKRRSYVESIAKLIPFERVSRAGLLKASRSKDLEASVMPILYKAMKRKLEEVSDDDVDGKSNANKSLNEGSASVKAEAEDEKVDDDRDADEDDEEESDHVKEPNRKVLRVVKKEPLPPATPSAVALTLLAQLPSNKMIAVPHSVYAIGGSNREANQAIHKYDVASKKWTSVPLKLPFTRGSAGGCVVGQNVMLCGGRKNLLLTADIDLFAGLKNQVFTLPNAKLSAPRYGCCAAVIADGIMICGGREDEDSVTTVERLVISSGKVAPLASMQRGRCDAAAVVVGNGAAVLVAGGPDESALPIELYECPRNAWSFVGALSTVRYAMGAVALGDNVYYAGGYDVNGQAHNTVEVFNTRTGQLRTLESKMKQPRGGCGMVSLDGMNTFAVFGGKTSESAGRSRGLLNTVETFDIRTEQWVDNVVPRMPIPMADGLVVTTMF